MSEEEIKKQYANGIVNADEVIKSLIDKFKTDKTSVDIQQLQLIAEYLIYKVEGLQKENKELIAIAEVIKKLPVEFKDDRLLLLVDKTIINNGNYESNFINKDKIVKIKKQLENGEIRIYPGANGTEFAIRIIDKLLEE